MQLFKVKKKILPATTGISIAAIGIFYQCMLKKYMAWISKGHWYPHIAQ